jgi:hypothetical protein
MSGLSDILLQSNHESDGQFGTELNNSKFLSVSEHVGEFYKLYHHQFVSCSLRKHHWYQYAESQHRWILLEPRCLLSSIETYLNLGFRNRRSTAFKHNFVLEARMIFFDSDFEKKLDADRNLLGFTNGVYDLSQHRFRDGRPEDYVSLSLGYDYKVFENSDQILNDLRLFLSQLLPKEEIRKSVLDDLSAFLGHLLPIASVWYGSGSNGKSALARLFASTCDPYGRMIPSSWSEQQYSEYLKHARWVLLQESDNGEDLSESLIRWIETGHCPMIVCTNYLPEFDQIYQDRIKVVNFTSEFVTNPNPSQYLSDPHICEKLDAWKQAFMFMLLQNRIQSNDL